MTSRTELAASFDIKSEQAKSPTKGVWTIGAESTNVRICTFQVQDANGAPVKRLGMPIMILAYATTAKAGFNTGSTGITATAGWLLAGAMVAGDVLMMLTDANGLVSVDYTDTGTATCALEATIPGSDIQVLSAQFANA